MEVEWVVRSYFSTCVGEFHIWYFSVDTLNPKHDADTAYQVTGLFLQPVLQRCWIVNDPCISTGLCWVHTVLKPSDSGRAAAGKMFPLDAWITESHHWGTAVFSVAVPHSCPSCVLYFGVFVSCVVPSVTGDKESVLSFSEAVASDSLEWATRLQRDLG